jgi:hypothetical protein
VISYDTHGFRGRENAEYSLMKFQSWRSSNVKSDDTEELKDEKNINPVTVENNQLLADNWQVNAPSNASITSRYLNDTRRIAGGKKAMTQ